MKTSKNSIKFQTMSLVITGAFFINGCGGKISKDQALGEAGAVASAGISGADDRGLAAKKTAMNALQRDRTADFRPQTSNTKVNLGRGNDYADATMTSTSSKRGNSSDSHVQGLAPSTAAGVASSGAGPSAPATTSATRRTPPPAPESPGLLGTALNVASDTWKNVKTLGGAAADVAGGAWNGVWDLGLGAVDGTLGALGSAWRYVTGS